MAYGYASCQMHCWPEAPHLTPASLRPSPRSASAGRPPEEGVVSRDRKPFAQARGASPGRFRSEAMAGLTNASQRAPPGANTSAMVEFAPSVPPSSKLPVLSSKRPASLLGPDPASAVKKRASLLPYNEFCQELRPLLPARLRNAEREKILGAAWKGLSDHEKHKFRAAGTPMPPPSGLGRGRGRGRRHGDTRVALAQKHAPTHASELDLAAPLAPQLRLAAPPAPQLQLAAPPVPQLRLAAPPAPQLQLTMEPPQLQLTMAPAQLIMAPAQLTMAQLTSVPLHTMYLDLPAPLFPKLAAPPPPPSRAPELLAAAAAHRTFVEEHFMGENQQAQQLAHKQQLMAEITTLGVEEIEMMEQQMTGEDAMDFAFSLGMPRV
jgi:hypothetical protein